MPTETQASTILSNARTFYKGGLKSTNKMYVGTDDEDIDEMTKEKMRNRNKSVQVDVQLQLLELRKGHQKLKTHGASPVRIGKSIVASKKLLATAKR